MTLLAWTGQGWAGNLDSYYLSGEAALQGGAITASTSHGGAIWYNPAGLANIRGSRLDASVSAYALHLGGQPDIDSISGTAQTIRLRTVDFRVVPAAVSYVLRIGGATVGAGVFVPRLQTTFLRTRVRAVPHSNTDGNGSASEIALDAYGRSQDYFAGLSIGWEIARHVNFGASLFAIYRNYLSFADATLDYVEGTTPLLLQSHSTLDWQQFGVQPVLGLQVLALPMWQLGFAVRFPSLRIYEIRQSVDSVVAATPAQEPGVAHQSEFKGFNGFSVGLILPTRFHIGIARTFSNAQVGLDLSYSEPLYNEGLQVNWKPTVNARIGGKVHAGDQLAIGGGLFTDRSPERRARTFGDTKIDYYGITACIDWGTLYGAVDVSNPNQRKVDTFRFGTTIALSYAIGVGQGVSTSVEFQNGAQISEVSRSVTAHEITLQLASSLAQ